jgi:hypothetical protein
VPKAIGNRNAGYPAPAAGANPARSLLLRELKGLSEMMDMNKHENVIVRDRLIHRCREEEKRTSIQLRQYPRNQVNPLSGPPSAALRI